MLESDFLESMPVRPRPCLERSIKLIHDVEAGRIREGDALGSVAYMEMLQGLEANGWQ